MRQPIVVSSFRGPAPDRAGTGNVGDVTLRLAGADDETVDLVLPATSPEVFAGVRGIEAALESALNDVELSEGTPAITSITPATAEEDTATEIVIAGTGFQAGAQVFVGGEPCTDVELTELDGTELTCTTPDDLEVGDHDVVVVNPNAEVAIEVEGFEATAGA